MADHLGSKKHVSRARRASEASESNAKGGGDVPAKEEAKTQEQKKESASSIGEKRKEIDEGDSDVSTNGLVTLDKKWQKRVKKAAKVRCCCSYFAYRRANDCFCSKFLVKPVRSRRSVCLLTYGRRS